MILSSVSLRRRGGASDRSRAIGDDCFQGIDQPSFQRWILPEKCHPCRSTDLSPMSPDHTAYDLTAAVYFAVLVVVRRASPAT